MVDYSPLAAFKQNRRLCFDLTTEIDALLEGKPPTDVDFTHVGCVAEARIHLEKAVKHLRDARKEKK